MTKTAPAKIYDYIDSSIKPLKRRLSGPLAAEVKKKFFDNALFQEVVSDVMNKLGDTKDSKEVTKKAKAYWKTNSKLGSDDFKEFWTKIREKVQTLYDSQKSSHNVQPKTKVENDTITSENINGTYHINETLENDKDNDASGKVPEEDSSSILTQKKENPWKKLWMPHYRNSCQFTWDM